MIPGSTEEVRRIIKDFPGLKSCGSYNSLPQPWCVISEDEFASRLAWTAVIAVESRQPEELEFRTVKIFWLRSQNGVGVLYRVWPLRSAGPIFLHFGCRHRVLEEKTHRCKRCGAQLSNSLSKD